MSEPEDKSADFKIDLLRITHEGGQHLPVPAPGSSESKKDYFAVTVEHGGKCYYWTKGVTLEVTKDQLERVRGNPLLHYFSTALRLHIQIEKINESKMASAEKTQWRPVHEDQKKLSTFVQDLNRGVKFDDLDDEMKEWWLKRY